MPSGTDLDDYLADKNPQGVRLFRRFEQLVQECGPSEPAVSRTVVYFRRKRVFAGGFVSGRRLEIVIDLLRAVDHACSIGSFATSKSVVSNRFRVSDDTQLDSVATLLREAYETVGPGTRG